MADHDMIILEIRREDPIIMKVQMLEGQSATCGTNIEPAREANDTWLESLFGSILTLFISLFALWLCLTVFGFIGLRGTLFLQSPSLSIGLAALLATIFCIVGFPLVLPWLLAFVATAFFLPRNSFFWKWWVRTPLGMIAGVLALWIDAFAYSLLSSGTLFQINVPVLQLASLPAAIMAGAACLSGKGVCFFDYQGAAKCWRHTLRMIELQSLSLLNGFWRTFT
jgi:hypothetical protein